MEGLGLNLSDAVNMFLRQVILQNGIPFEVKYPEFKPEVIEAMEEAKQISRDPNTKRYSSFSEALEDMGCFLCISSLLCYACIGCPVITA